MTPRQMMLTILERTIDYIQNHEEESWDAELSEVNAEASIDAIISTSRTVSTIAEKAASAITAQQIIWGAISREVVKTSANVYTASLLIEVAQTLSANGEHWQDIPFRDLLEKVKREVPQDHWKELSELEERLRP